MKNLNLGRRSVPFALLLLSLLSFGLLIPWLGFYWDDWPFIYFSRLLGPSGYIDVFAHDRPFLAGIYILTTPVLGLNPLPWQIFGILCRWAAALSVWWSLRQIWPHAGRQAAWVALLFTVYPGFGQQAISVIYSQAFLLLASSIFSLGCMVWALRRPRRFWLLTTLSLFTALFSLLSTEYFFSLELLRPFFLFVYFGEQGLSFGRRLKKTLLYWLPYLVMLVIFWVWRTFFLETSYSVAVLTPFEQNPLAVLRDFIQVMLRDGYTAGWRAWSQAFNGIFTLDLTIRSSQLMLLAAVVVLALTVFYLLNLRLDPQPTQTTAADALSPWAPWAAGIGLVSLITAGVPFWAGGQPFGLEFPWNRFTLAMMLGSSLLLVGLVDFFIHTTRQKAVLLALIISLAAGWNFNTANTYRREWQSFKDFFWQLTWRMPGLQPHTMLLTHELPFTYFTDNSLTAPLNWIYAPENYSRDMLYKMNYTRMRYRSSLPSLEPGAPIHQEYRALVFDGSTDQSITIYQSGAGCLRVMDPVFTNAETLPNLPNYLKLSIPVSNLDQIIPDAAPPTQPPAQYFGAEPQPEWCYYFEKADLARQTGDWQKAVSLAAEAEQAGFKPTNLSEWYPFIEAYLHTGDWDPASLLTQRVAAKEPSLTPGLCQIWERFGQETSLTDLEKKMVTEVTQLIKCDAVE